MFGLVDSARMMPLGVLLARNHMNRNRVFCSDTREAQAIRGALVLLENWGRYGFDA
jgi:hypothetical protein